MKQKLILPLLLLSLLLSMGNLQKRREALADRIAPFHSALPHSRQQRFQNRSGRKAGGTQFSLRLYPGPPAGKRRQQERAVSGWLFENKTSLEICRQPFSCRKANALLAHALSLERTWFPTRVYDDLVIPCGTYDAARLILGKGKGPQLVVRPLPAVLFSR